MYVVDWIDLFKDAFFIYVTCKVVRGYYMIFGFSKTMYIFIYMYKNFSLLQKKRETLASIDTLVSESFGQFVLRNELCGLAKNLPLLY